MATTQALAGAAAVELISTWKPSESHGAGKGGGSGSGDMAFLSMRVPACGLLSLVAARRVPCFRASFQGISSERIGRRQVCRPVGTALRDQAEAAASVPTTLSPDLFLLDLASKLEDSIAEGDDSGADGALSKLREESTEATLNLRWPTNKDEAYRFTDLRFLTKASICPVVNFTAAKDSSAFDPSSLKLPAVDQQSNRVVFVDGVFSTALSKADDLPDGVIVGSISTLSKEVLGEHVLPMLSGVAGRSQGDVFACLNGVGARDLGVIVVPTGVKVPKSLQITYISTQGDGPLRDGEGPSFQLSSPRLLVIVEKDAAINFVEDFIGATDATYFTNSVCEIRIAEGGQVSHNFVQEQNRTAVHIRQTYVSQAEASSYKLVEFCFGGRLSRHNLHVQQFGPDTSTEFSSFLLAGRNQLHDLHSKLILSHPGGFSRQLHKCIVADSSGHAVFDGNVKVNRYAQKTDAGQLSRSLLLAPKATVNVKPNLQIIANDVKCSHGAAISDLEDEQLLYFRTRGIDEQAARSALVFSFGAEVVQRLDSDVLKRRVESLVKESLSSKGAIKTSVPITVLSSNKIDQE